MVEIALLLSGNRAGREHAVCGLGFVGLIILLFYAFLVFILLSYGGWCITKRILKRVRGRGVSVPRDN